MRLLEDSLDAVAWSGLDSDVNWNMIGRVGSGRCCWKCIGRDSDWTGRWTLLLIIPIWDAVVVDCCVQRCRCARFVSCWKIIWMQLLEDWKWIEYGRRLEGLEGKLIGKTLIGRGWGVVVDCSDWRCCWLFQKNRSCGRCCWLFRSMLLLIVPIDVLAVAGWWSIQRIKSGVSILIEFPWCSAIIGLLLLIIIIINYTYNMCNKFCFVFETLQTINNEWILSFIR